MYRICKNAYGMYKIQKLVKKEFPKWMIFLEKIISFGALDTSPYEEWEDVSVWDMDKIGSVDNGGPGFAIFYSYENANIALRDIIKSTPIEEKKSDDHWEVVE